MASGPVQQKECGKKTSIRYSDITGAVSEAHRILWLSQFSPVDWSSSISL